MFWQVCVDFVQKSDGALVGGQLASDVAVSLRDCLDLVIFGIPQEVAQPVVAI